MTFYQIKFNFSFFNFADNSLIEEQLKLCLAWNRADIARKYIFEEDKVSSLNSLNNYLVDAFIEVNKKN